MTDGRPSHITPADWARMPWHARERAIVRETAKIRTRQAMPEARPLRGKRAARRRIRIYKVDDYCWEITNGVSTARCGSAQAAWSLVARLGTAA